MQSEALRGCVKMVANMLRRDGTPSRVEAADELEKAFAALASPSLQPEPVGIGEVAAWRERFPAYVYRPQDDCVSLRLSTSQPAEKAEADHWFRCPVCGTPGTCERFPLDGIAAPLPTAPEGEITAEALQSLMRTLRHEDRPGNLWDCTTVGEKAVALKVLRAWLASPAAPRQAVTEALKQFEKARFGVFRPDGRFEELPETEQGLTDPQAHEGRWVGGLHDMQLLRAALSPSPAAQALGGEQGAKPVAVVEYDQSKADPYRVKWMQHPRYLIGAHLFTREAEEKT